MFTWHNITPSISTSQNAPQTLMNYPNPPTSVNLQMGKLRHGAVKWFFSRPYSKSVVQLGIKPGALGLHPSCLTIGCSSLSMDVTQEYSLPGVVSVLPSLRDLYFSSQGSAFSGALEWSNADIQWLLRLMAGEWVNVPSREASWRGIEPKLLLLNLVKVSQSPPPSKVGITNL